MSMNVQFVIVSPDGSTEVTSSAQTIMNADELQNLMILARTSTDDQDQSLQTVELIPEESNILESDGKNEVILDHDSHNSILINQQLMSEPVPMNVDDQGSIVQPESVLQHGTILHAVMPNERLSNFMMKHSVPTTAGEIADQTTTKKKKRYNKDKNFPCPTCGKKFPSSSNLTRHIRIHTGEKPYTCEYCGNSYAQIDHLKRHEGLHTGNMAYECSVCNKKYQEKFRLVVHMRTHTGERPFKCPLCQKGFTTSRALVKHKRWHTGERNFECDFCLKKFVDYAGLSTHRKIHTGEKPHKCYFCQRGFIAKKDLISHERLHTGDLPFQCDTCQKKFPRKTALVQHQKTHTDDRPFECKFCHKTFRQKPSLRNHVLIHTGEFPFDCDFCLKRFRRKESMESHRLKHTGEPPSPMSFQCTACEKVMKSRRSLQLHMKTHVKSESFRQEACNNNNSLESVAHSNSQWLNQALHDYSKVLPSDSDDSNLVIDAKNIATSVSNQTELDRWLKSLTRRAGNSVSFVDIAGDCNAEFPDRKESFVSTEHQPNIPTRRKRTKSV